MSLETDALDRLIDQFVTGTIGFWPFWSAFMTQYVEGGLNDKDERRYEPAYDIVYMAEPARPSAEDHAVGLMGEAEVRSALEAFRAQLVDDRPA